jgi:hypothetical protein
MPDLNANRYDMRQPFVSKVMICPFLYTAHCSVHLKICVNLTEFISPVKSGESRIQTPINSIFR